jgi:prevent-host-death family protein
MPEMKFIVSTEAQNNFGRLLDDVATHGTRYVVRRHGTPKAVVLPLADLERLLALEQDGERVLQVLRENQVTYRLGELVEVL